MEKTTLRKLKNLYRRQYVSRMDLDDFVTRHYLEMPSRAEARRKILKLATALRWQECVKAAKLYYYLYYRDQLNRKFIKREQKKDYRVEGNKLDPQQIAAVVACEDAELILAPAGSGKTASLLAKLNYLTGVLQIPAEEILVIAFTNKVVAELKDRVKQAGVEIRTFHSLGNKILRAELEGRRLVTEQQTDEFFRRTVQELCQRDPEYARRHEAYLQSDDDKFLSLIKGGQTEDLPGTMIAIQGLQKAERISLTELKRRIETVKDPAERKKAERFYELYVPVADAYVEYLEQEGLYDFADMLNQAADLVLQMPKGHFGYRYVLVDEAQDLSTSKYLLLKAVLDNCRGVKLFAVGDDWQSIYRFAGSNLRVLDDFEQIFGRETYRGMIETTYRFGQPTAKISNKFIRQNPHQSKKKVMPKVRRRTRIEVRLSEGVCDGVRGDGSCDGGVRDDGGAHPGVPEDYAAVDGILQELYAEYGEEIFAKKIQVISRYNLDVLRLVGEAGAYGRAKYKAETGELEWSLPGEERKLVVPFCSMHKAKGITRDIIIVINANSGGHGMPATRGSGPVAEVLMAKMDAYPHAEERRLWYVAITRAKLGTFIVAEAGRVSPFVFEVSPKLRGANAKVCPKCHQGIMQEKRRRDGKMYCGCPHCRYVK